MSTDLNLRRHSDMSDARSRLEERTTPENFAPASGSPRNEYEAQSTEKPLSLPQELWLFVMENKSWWMIPILLVCALLGFLFVLGSTGAAPIIDTLF